MAALHPPVCPICGPPHLWRPGLVFHAQWIHYRESRPCPEDPHQWEHLETIVERTWRPPARPEPALAKRPERNWQHQVLEIG